MDLLERIDSKSFKFFMAVTNMLSSIVPAASMLMELPEPAYFLDDNQFISIDKKLCEGKEFGYNSILCPIRTYSEIGRQVSKGKPYLACSYNTQFIGMTHCGAVENDDDD
jgi:hypothetical protein